MRLGEMGTTRANRKNSQHPPIGYRKFKVAERRKKMQM
jgi:hypothetical protein